MVRRILVPLSLLVLLGCAVGGLAGCAAGASSSRAANGHGAESPRVRCLSDARGDAASGSRPLFFLFCVESP